VKARLVPLYLRTDTDPDFVAQLTVLTGLLEDVATFLPPLPLGAALPTDADAVVLPQLVGDAYGRVSELRALTLPILVLTSEFGTMAMWDWELIAYLRSEGVATLAPYTLHDTMTVCRALVAKRELRGGTFLVYQDEPGEAGFQPAIFKRFYWWEEECRDRMHAAFGVRVVERSFRELGARAKAIPDGRARAEWERLDGRVPVDGVGERRLLAALKLYLALRDDYDGDDDVLAMGVNCLNESASSDSTPCLAWNLLYRERDLIWGCEADTVSMLTKFVLHRSLRAPVIMTNLYPFLMGQAALKHERIPAFPPVDGKPEDHVLAAHCGYFGVVPQEFATEWKLRGKVLPIVGEDATAIDARLPVGDLTLAKLEPTFDRLVAFEGELVGYAGTPGSDCLNGGVIRVPDGHALMQRLPSHHSLLVAGHHRAGLELLGKVFDLEVAA
jgi:hypothetical protein